MAGSTRERVRDWMRRRFPPVENYVRVFECDDVTQLLGNEEHEPPYRAREGTIFASRDAMAPAPRKEIVILTRVLAGYSAERIITILDRSVVELLASTPHQQVLLDDNLVLHAWGTASTGPEPFESEPCETAPFGGSA